MAKYESLIVEKFEQCDIIDVLRIGEGRGILQKETDGKDAPVSVRAYVGMVKLTVPKLKDLENI